jgi:hypothetical protein
MSAPNLATVSTITAKSVKAALVTTGTDVLTNAADSGKVFKVNNIVVGNIDGTNSATVTVRLSKSGSAVSIFSGISVPAAASLILIDKNTAIYLEENDVLHFLASADNDLTAMVNYEEIS